MAMQDERLLLASVQRVAHVGGIRRDKGRYGIGLSARFRHHFHMLIGFMFGFCMAFATLLLQDRRLIIESERLEYRANNFTSTEFYRQTGQMTTTDEGGAELLQTQARILCMILTCAHYHESRAMHVRATWGKRCDKLIFVSSKQDDDLGAVALIDESADNWYSLWNKTRQGLRYVYENFRDDYDWFVKADDDTFMIVENLRYMLHAYESSIPICFGYTLAQNNITYTSGGASYVLSKEALRRFMVDGFYNESLCSENSSNPPEDFELSQCLQSVGVSLVDSRLATVGDNKSKMFPLELASYMAVNNINESIPDWLFEFSTQPVEVGLDCCSNMTISFHYVDPPIQYVFEFLIYHLQVYGRRLIQPKLPAKRTMAELQELFDVSQAFPSTTSNRPTQPNSRQTDLT